jgi:hypothetical protein
MKKLVLLVILFALAGFLAYKLLWEKKPVVAEKKDAPLRIGRNTGVFNTAFAGVMGDYYSLKDSLVEWDMPGADIQANALMQKTDSLPFKELHADSMLVITARDLAASVSNEAKGLIGEKDIAQKRKAFNMLTAQIYDLIRTVQYDGEIIYHIRCPMAFGDSLEGFWLTNTSKIVNPYLGKKHPVYGAKMIGCGEVTDSMDFTKK